MHRSSGWAERVRELVRAAATALRDDRGSASIEFLTVGLILLVPLVYLVLALGQIQHAVLGIEGAARHAARVVAAADSHPDGLAAADRAIRVALDDAGLEPAAVRVAVTCSPQPAACTTPRGTVSVQLDATVPLPLAPPVLHLDTGVGVPVSARATQPVSAFGGAP